MTTKEACGTLESAADYLLAKSYLGDDGGSLMNYWDWNVVMSSAIGILEDALTQIQLEAYK